MYEGHQHSYNLIAQFCIFVYLCNFTVCFLLFSLFTLPFFISHLFLILIYVFNVINTIPMTCV